MKALLKQGRGRRWQVQVFLDIFSGSGGVAKKLRGLGYLVLEIDIAKGQEWDVGRQKVQSLIRGWMAAGLVWGVHLATPCNSLSHARDRGAIRTLGSTSQGWPGRLRNKAEPWGINAVTLTGDRLCILAGNKLAKFSAALLELALWFRIAISIENPDTSWLWSLPPMKRLARRPEYSEARSHFCAFGARWRKPTRVAGFHIDLTILDRRCHGRCICEYSQKPHMVLSGASTENKMMTKLAEAYLRRFAAALAIAHSSAKAKLWVRHLTANSDAFKSHVSVRDSYGAPAHPPRP